MLSIHTYVAFIWVHIDRDLGPFTMQTGMLTFGFDLLGYIL